MIGNDRIDIASTLRFDCSASHSKSRPNRATLLGARRLAERFLREAPLRAGRQLLYGPAVAVRVAEEDERAPGELLDLTDLHAPLHELGTRGVDV